MLNEQDFFKSPNDMYAIYQLKPEPEYHLLRFAALDELQGQPIDKHHYNLVYSGSLYDINSTETMDLLEELYTKFNLKRPDDFTGHSLSVSDVIVLKQGGSFHSFYTNSFGFTELTGFLPIDNPLKNAEMVLEDDFNMIDGLINNGPRQEVPGHGHIKYSREKAAAEKMRHEKTRIKKNDMER